MAAPSGSGISAAQKVGRMSKWWFRVRDMPELLVLYGLVGGVFVAGLYSTKRVMLNNTAGAYWDVQMRGNPELQTEAGRTGFEDPASGKRSMWYHIAQWKVDEKGANIGVLWDNRTRPHQYSKPGEAGLAAGLSNM
eukprot:GHRQ01001361.1.p2 GENE.GHRQ01001361.1~~GHRQ01001361.1.p2  ORF type:complete len:136 (+),score=44.75 GHRQ01001361.1:202-609(+)